MKNRKSIWFTRREEITLSLPTLTTKERTKDEEGVHESIGIEEVRRGKKHVKPASEETSVLLARHELSPNRHIE